MEFEGWGFVSRAYQIDRGIGGIKAVMWVVPNADPAKVAEAHKFHVQLRAPSEGLGMENHLLQLVEPIVEGMIENHDIVLFPGDRDRYLPLKVLRGRFFKEHGYFPNDLPAAAKKVIEEHGFKMIQER